MKKNMKKKEGITLIALVVTIVILLILASVSIAMLTGENSLINKAKEAKSETEIAAAKEEVTLLYNEVILEHFDENPDNEQIASYLQEKLREQPGGSEEDTVVYNASNDIFSITYKGCMFEIQSNGSLTNNRQEEKSEITSAWENVSSGATVQEKVIILQEKLPNSTVSYDEETGKITVESSNSNWEIDPDTGEITESKPKDVIPPTVTLKVISVTSNSITIKAIAEDSDSGLAETDTYKFYVSTSQTYSSEPEETNTTGEYTISNLDANTQYYIKVEVKDKSKNVATEEISQATELIPTAESSITRTINWNSEGTAEITLSTETNYTIQYSLDEGQTWDNYNTKISLENGDTIEIVLTDGRNKGEIYRLEVKDETPPNLEIKVTSVTSNSITIKAIAEDSDSGLAETDTYKIYVSGSQVYDAKPTITNTTGEYTISNLDTNTQYYIKVEVSDKVGNIATEEISQTTELIPTAESSITRAINWSSDGTAEITLSTETNYTIQYSLDDGKTWDNYSTKIPIKNGNTVKIVLTDGRNQGESYTLEIKDETGPKITITNAGADSSYIKVNVMATDDGAGMSEETIYKYYIKQNGQEDNEYVLKQTTTNTQYTFEGLTANISYVIKVTAEDLLGNIGEATIIAPTSQLIYVKGSITYSDISWENEEANVNIINNKTQYYIQYQIIEPGGTDTDNWITSTKETTSISGLKNGNLVIARLYDGTNATSDYATCNIEDGNNPQITSVEQTPEEWTNGAVTLSIVATDTESGLADEPYSFDGGKTWQASKTKTYEQNTNNIVVSVKDKAGNVETYINTINIINIDKTGPEIEAEVTTKGSEITVNITKAEDNGVGLAELPYSYYISTEYSDLDSSTPTTQLQKVENVAEITKTFQSEVGKTYYIKIEAKDQFGNSTTVNKTITAGALEVSENDLSLGNVNWAEEQASIVLSTTTEYAIEYQIVSKGEVFVVDGDWTNSSEKEITVSGLKHNDTIYARLTDGNNFGTTQSREIKDNTLPTITNVKQSSTEWTKGTVTLTVEASDNESGLAYEPYSFDGGATWQGINTKEYDTNTNNIVVQVKDKAENIATYTETINITNIDTTGPNISATVKETTTKSITITINSAIDSGVGMATTPEYTYYLNGTKKETTSNTEYTFNNLTANQNYTIKIEAKDTLGNVGTTEITSRTYELPTPNITFSNTIWHNGLATITVSSSEKEYNMQYQIAENGEEIDTTEDSNWTTVTDPIASDDDSVYTEIENLKNGTAIYVRLTDNYNTTTDYATIIIDNPAAESYTESELASTTTRDTYNILGVSVANNSISVKIDKQQENASTYNYYYKTINDDKYTLISTNTNYDENAVITDIKEGETYKVKVLVLNNNGNITRCENTVTAIALEQATTGQIYTSNRTYIDSNGYTMTLPASFKISSNSTENTQAKGIVISDSSNNEYVWIPVNDAIYDGVTTIPTSTTSSSTYKPMATKQSSDTNFYESIIYAFNNINSYRYTTNAGVGKTGYKEPSLLTGNASDGYSWKLPISITGANYDVATENLETLGFSTAQEFGEYLANSYNNMINAVDGYGGFYVGRYETTTDNGAIGSKVNTEVITNTNWYTLYKSNSTYNSTSVKSSMIWGSQWDAMLNYFLTGEDKTKVASKIGTQKNNKSNSGEDSTDIINNVYDLGSNVYEWTQEAYSYNYRVYRGGSYDSSMVGRTSVARGGQNVITTATTGSEPTDQGSIYGTRMALYIQSTNDITKPTITTSEITSTSNTITVEVLATDKETGISNYKYYISSDNGSSWDLVSTQNSNTYTYTGLNPNTEYYIKIVAVDGAGNEGETEKTQISTANLGAIATTNITIVQKYGPTGSGTVQLELSSEYADSGYYIEYQVNSETETWNKGSLITGLSNGDVIYAQVTDGTNTSSDQFKYTVEGLEEYAYIDSSGNTYTEDEAKATKGTSYDTNIKYTDSTGKTAMIPAGFKIGITDSVNDINNGLVIQDELGNQFVWIPVENVVYDGTTAMSTSSTSTSTYKPMARYQSGYSANTEKQYFEGILYNFGSSYTTGSYAIKSTNTLGTSGYREATLITNGADYTWNVASAKGSSYDTLESYYKYMGYASTTGVEAFSSYTEFGQYMNSEYSKMIQSVQKYGGFYTGRYETSVSGTVGSKTAVAQSQIGKDPIKNQNWYKDYYTQDSNLNSSNPYYNSTSVTSSMIWGSQYDAIMNWMLEDSNTASFVTAVTGNRSGTTVKTGATASDLAKNIFDLSGNVVEWTQEGYSTYIRMYRGGSCLAESDVYGTYVASSRYVSSTCATTNTGINSQVAGGTTVGVSNMKGSRMALYINIEEDTTAPEIELLSTSKGTNNIQVTVDSSDKETGISNYKYCLYDNSTMTTPIKEVTTYGNTYTFEKLTQNTTYYITIKSINGAGVESETIETGAITTDTLNVQESDIMMKKVYGKNGSGIAYFEISSDLSEQGYYLQYQLSETYDENGTWTKLDTTTGTITGLSEGDNIQLIVYDGINKSTYHSTATIEKLEEYSEVYTQTQAYTDSNGDTAVIPKGFKVGTTSIVNTIANGLVIEDETGNQYVWIPVENAIYDETTTLPTSTSSESTYKPMVRYQQGCNTSTTNQYFEMIRYTYSGTKSYIATASYTLGTSGYREPSLVTGSTANYSWLYNAGSLYDAANYSTLNDLGITDTVIMGKYMNDKYTEMIQSIVKNGGFYVGRYETSIFTEDGQNKDSTQATATIVKSIAGAVPMASVNWYKMYLCQDSNYTSNPYNTSTSVTSSMIWGSQYDAMLNYILTGSDALKVTAVTGNHTGTRSSTGKYGSDIMNNIFDLSSNVLEWTQEANSKDSRVRRGGNYHVTSTRPASVRSNSCPTGTDYSFGSRLALYIK